MMLYDRQIKPFYTGKILMKSLFHLPQTNVIKFKGQNGPKATADQAILFYLFLIF